MEFIEAPAFARYREQYFSDDGFCELQRVLAENPEAGSVMPGTGGARKLRWQDVRRGKGRRGGLRVIYYSFPVEDQIYLMTVYGKDELKDLTPEQKRRLRAAIEQEKRVRGRNRER